MIKIQTIKNNKHILFTAVIGILLVVLFSVVLFSDTANYQQNKQSDSQQQSNEIKFKKGEQLYRDNCIACHAYNMRDAGTAPALGGITKKRDLKWLYDYTRNPFAPRFKNDAVVIEIRKKGWGVMPTAAHLKNEDLDALYFYVEERYQMTLKGIPVEPYFNFDASENKNAKWCIHVVDENKPILFARHTMSKQWFFGCKEKHTSNEWKSTTLRQVFEKDKTINDLDLLPKGFYAKRYSRETEWEYFMK